MSSEELREQVAAIKPGDTVTARFYLAHIGEWTVTAEVRALGTDCLQLGTCQLTRGDQPMPYLVTIESHEPAKPPVPPEPAGDFVVQIGAAYYEPLVDGSYASDDAHVDDWAALVAKATPAAPMLILRPVPSQERIEELVKQFEDEFDLTPRGKDWVRQEIAALLGGGQS